MFKWIPSEEAKRASERERTRKEEETERERECKDHEAKRQWERMEQEKRRERERKEEEVKRARERHGEQIIAEVVWKEEFDRWDRHMRSLQDPKPRKSGCCWPK